MSKVGHYDFLPKVFHQKVIILLKALYLFGTELTEQENQGAKPVNICIPVKSKVELGMTIPTFGRTQYFLGDVVLTCQYHPPIRLQSRTRLNQEN